MRPCLTPAHKSHSSPRQHLVFTSTSDLNVLVILDKSAWVLVREEPNDNAERNEDVEPVSTSDELEEDDTAGENGGNDR